MTSVFLLSTFLVSGTPFPIWEDPEMTMLVRESGLPPDVSAALRDPSRRRKKLLRLLEERPEDWTVHAAVRGLIAHTRDAQLAKEAVDVLHRQSLKIVMGYPRWRLRKLFSGGMASHCNSLTRRGYFSVDRLTQQMWSSETSDVYGTRPAELRTRHDAYILLSVYKQSDFYVKKGRQVLAACEKRFGLDPVLATYAVSLYYAGVRLGKPVLAGRNAKVPTPEEIDALPDPKVVRRSAMYAWSRAKGDPGLLAVSAAGLVALQDPAAKKVMAEYLASKDPAAWRLARIKKAYAERIGDDVDAKVRF